MNTRDRLIELITDNNLERLDVAEMLKVKLSQVDAWLASNESKHHEEAPEMAVELLELKLKLRSGSD
ncbi:MAG: hypothetical protein R3318_02470 [Gammaproteobacteria bacterium]|nr:hypothetical protein [Gammaproteobacteria bacterium]